MQKLKVERRMVEMQYVGGTVYDPVGRDVGLADKGSRWWTVQLEWGEGPDPFVMLINDENFVTWAHLEEFVVVG